MHYRSYAGLQGEGENAPPYFYLVNGTLSNNDKFMKTVQCVRERTRLPVFMAVSDVDARRVREAEDSAFVPSVIREPKRRLASLQRYNGARTPPDPSSSLPSPRRLSAGSWGRTLWARPRSGPSTRTWTRTATARRRTFTCTRSWR